MPSRMLCTHCGVTAHADTLIEGSDRIELAAWMLGAVLGWLYCARRHWLRTKVCACCGSPALVREARAAAVAAPGFSCETRVVTRSPALAWPRRWRSPRERLRAGAPAAGLAALLGVVGLGAALRGVPFELLGLAGAAWTLSALAFAGVNVLRRRAGLDWQAGGCRAWDASGRRLHIEVV